VIEDNRELHLIQKHMITAQMVRNRLATGPLTAQEVIDGVRLSHEEYLDLIDRLVGTKR
jgi:hypothetical protein